MSKVVWLDGYNPYDGTTNGYVYASTNIKKSLLKDYRLGVTTTADLIQLESLPKLPPGIGYFLKTNREDCDLIVNNQLPLAFQVPSKNFAGSSVGFCYWETSRLPKSFVQKLNMMDEVWTTSKWAKEVFEDSGVEVDVFDFNLGVDTEIYNLVPERQEGPFTFLSIGSPSTRKNSQMAVDAFLKLFGGDKNYRLLYKSSGPPDARLMYNGENHGAIFMHPQIECFDYEMSERELSDLYGMSDCLLYPTSGEGWGMMPFQAIAKGIPTICTNATACTEFAELSIPLDYKWGTEKMSGVYSGCGEWAIPDFDDLCDKMLYVVNNYDEVKAHTMSGAWIIRNNYTWKDVSLDYYNAILDLTT